MLIYSQQKGKYMSAKGKIEVDFVELHRLRTGKIALEDALESALIKIDGLMGSESNTDADVKYLRRVLANSKK
jgi:hypothetical protein